MSELRFNWRGWVSVCLVALSIGGARADIVTTSFVDGSLLKYSDTGAFLGVLVPGGTAGLALPAGLALGNDGNIYVSNQATGDIMKFNAWDGSFQGIFASLGPAYQPAGLRFGPDGDLYVSQFGAGVGAATVDRYNGTTGAFVASVLTGLTQPTGLHFDANGHLFATVIGEGRVVRFDGSSQSTFIAAGSSPLVGPSAISVGPDGNYYVVDLFAGAVLQYDPNGNFLSSFATGPLLGEFPSDLLFTADGRLLVGTLGQSFASPTGNIETFDALTGAYLGNFAGPIWGASQLLFVPIPEPATLALIGVAIGMGWPILRNRKMKKAESTAV